MAEQLLNMKFVYEVEKNPCLYNYNLKEYSRKDITEKTWASVGEIFNLTALQAKEKWKNIRTVFVRHLKQGPSKIRKYYLNNAMQFAIPFIKVVAGLPACQGQSQGQDVSEEIPNEEEIETLDSDQNAPPSPPPLIARKRSLKRKIVNLEDNETLIESDHNYAPTTPSPPPINQISNHSPTAAQNNRKRKLNDLDEEFHEFMKSKTAKTDQDKNDSNKMFLLSLLPDLNSMSPTDLRTFKRKVTVMVENILNPPQKKAHSPEFVQISDVQHSGTSAEQTQPEYITLKNEGQSVEYQFLRIND